MSLSCLGEFDSLNVRLMLCQFVLLLFANPAVINAPLPGMPPVLDPKDIYAADHANQLSPVVKSFPSYIYVPNTGSNRVDVIDPKRFKIVRT
jgi:hypothetical protein